MAVLTQSKVCVVIGASHAGTNLAFALRKEGWEGAVILFDADKEFPYHRPPLSKTYLTSEEITERSLLFPKERYIDEDIVLKLGIEVKHINRKGRFITLDDGSIQSYDTLVIATGARPFIPLLKGMDVAQNVFPMRTAEDASNIRKAVNSSKQKRVVVIGGGYIGLETAASLSKLGAKIVVLEKEDRVLPRVTARVMSDFFTELHQSNGIAILTNKNITSVKQNDGYNTVICDDGSEYKTDVIVLGVGIQVNTELAKDAGLAIENGIQVDETGKTNDKFIYSVGDCTNHFNPHYKRYVRLESVQNALDQAKTAAKAICGQDNVVYDSIPWFWSDQFDVKLQIVGLSSGYDDVVIRREGGKSFSVWYFKEDELLAVDAVNFAKAYILGTNFIVSRQRIDKSKIVDINLPFKPNSFN
ncbi:NAD(P)/FAD-dependent oxidoreductase [Flagellimonas sp.]|uniref:NAD(P)/FAD-dependent oxidoreductase n=1 Tax=Flagellimonas sp. TaxID=2058762 RepID=UPI003B52DCEF